MKHILSYVLIVGNLIMYSCSKGDDPTDIDVPTDAISILGNSGVTKGTAEGYFETGEDEEDLIENSTFSNVVKIAFGATVSIDNPLDGSGVTVTQSDGDIVINATATGVEYVLSGTTSNGSVKFYSDKKFKLTLDGVSITNNDGPAINIQSGKRVFVVLNDNTTNSLIDAVTYSTSTEDQKGTFFSEGQLIFTGNGTLNIAGKNKHAIVSDDYIRIQSGTINITEAASDGIHANDYVIVDNGTIHVKASSDGIEAEKGHIIINDGVFSIDVGDDGIAASYDEDNTIDPYLVINGGTFDIKCAEGEGIESKSHLTINGGTITINAYDDAINAGTAIYINDGIIYARSTTNDGIDSNGILTITGGTTVAIGSTSPEAGFDNDNNTFKITGGLLLGLGGSTSRPTASSITQPAIILGSGQANQYFHLSDTDGNEIITFLSPVSYSTALVSSSKLQVGKSYILVSDGAVTNGTDSNGLYLNGSFTANSVSSNFTISSLLTSLGGSTGPGGR